tara:strand:- start:139 stop:414 length:276 start_codon:yes stop_codon:yes gene_type:complete
MNYQILHEDYAAGEGVNKDEILLIELEFYSQIESIKFYRTHQGFIEKAPKHICEAAQVCEGSILMDCFALILDKANPLSLRKKSRGAKLFD